MGTPSLLEYIEMMHGVPLHNLTGNTEEQDKKVDKLCKSDGNATIIHPKLYENAEFKEWLFENMTGQFLISRHAAFFDNEIDKKKVILFNMLHAEQFCKEDAEDLS